MNHYDSISKLYKMAWYCRLADDFIWQNGELNHLSGSGLKNFQIHALYVKQGKSKGNVRWTESTDIYTARSFMFFLFLRFTQGWKGHDINGPYIWKFSTILLCIWKFSGPYIWKIENCAMYQQYSTNLYVNLVCYSFQFFYWIYSTHLSIILNVEIDEKYCP